MLWGSKRQSLQSNLPERRAPAEKGKQQLSFIQTASDNYNNYNRTSHDSIAKFGDYNQNNHW